MRITGGRARGRIVPVALSPGVRPTSARVREALFSMLGSDLTGQRFLDVFGGAGLMGLEAWSRGATVTVIERNGRAHRDIVARGEAMGVDWIVHRGDALKWLERLNSFDVVFADPPYAMDIDPILENLAAVTDSVLIAETPVEFSPPKTVGGLFLHKQRTYGGSALSIFHRMDEEV